MVENGTSRDFTSRVVGPRNPKLVRHDDEIDQKGIRHILSTLIGKSWKTDPFFFYEISKIFRLVTQVYYWKTHSAWMVAWMSIPEIDLCLAQN